MVQIIVMDVDGTLLNSKREILPETRRWILKVQEKGVIVMLASGRPVNGLLHQIEKMGLNKEGMILLAFNGAVVADASTQTVYYQKTMELKLAQAIIRHVHDYPVSLMIPKGKELFVENPEGYHVRFEAAVNGLDLRVVDDLETIDFCPNKIMMSAEPAILDQFLDQIAEPFREQADFIKTAPFYFEVTDKDVHKGNALSHYCAISGISLDKVMAFGDNFNDMSMIETAGLGIAMGNAVAPLKEKADRVTLSNDEDGIAMILKEYFPD